MFIGRLSAGSGPSTYPADRDFKGHVGGGGAQPRKGFFYFFHIFRFFLSDFQGEKGWCTNEYITNFRIRTRDVVRNVELSELCLLMCPSPPCGQLPAWMQFWVDKVMALTLHFALEVKERKNVWTLKWKKEKKCLDHTFGGKRNHKLTGPAFFRKTFSDRKKVASLNKPKIYDQKHSILFSLHILIVSNDISCQRVPWWGHPLQPPRNSLSPLRGVKTVTRT